MCRIPKIVFIVVTLVLALACNLMTQPVPKAQSPAGMTQATDTQAPPVETLIPTRTTAQFQRAETPATPAQPPAPTNMAAPVFTPTAAARPAPADTAMPGVTPTAAAKPAPTAADTQPAAVPTQDPTMFALFGPMADLMSISQYYNPVGTPLSIWHAVPIMSQAIAGEEFKANIYSYKATAPLSQAVQYYTSKAASIGLPLYPPATSYGGTGNLAFHSTTFLSRKLTIVITSLDKDPQRVVVVIDKSP